MSHHPDGSFYIDDLTGDFYLRELGVWVLKGRFGDNADRATILFGNGPPPPGGIVGQEILVGLGAPPP